MNKQALVLVVEDDLHLRTALCDTLQFAGYRTCEAADGRKALDLLEQLEPGLIISDVQMPAMDGHELLQHCRRQWPEIPFVMMTAYSTVDQAVRAMRNGAADYVCKPFEAEVLIEVVARLALAPESCTSVVAEDAGSLDTLALARRVALTDASVMISGESGVGKEVYARQIHENSPRHEQAFVAINCAAIPESMLESILFGYEKGAFTGAHTARAGKFEQANGGTLLLDEISEMDLQLQAKLLRVLQEREVERLGGKKAIPLDVRILATTNRDLGEEVLAGRFREDLFYRLNVFPLQIAPLRDRPGDIIPLCRSFIRQLAPGEGISLDSFAEQLLLSYSWPGNVRELHNVVQRALIMKTGETVDPSAILFEGVGAMASPVAAPALEQPALSGGPALAEDLKSREYELIIETLNAENGSRKQAAARLGISPRTLRYKLARFREQGINVPQVSSGGLA